VRAWTPYATDEIVSTTALVGSHKDHARHGDIIHEESAGMKCGIEAGPELVDGTT